MQPSKGSAQRAQQNRTNAQNSTGPRTEEGKQRSSQNAIKHGLTGQAVLLLSEDAAAYESHLQKYLHDYQPKGIQEEDLVRSIAAVAWRLNRLLGIESKVLSQDTSTADDVYQQTRALSNLSLYEHRLARQAERSRKELKELQSDRRNRESNQIDDAVLLFEMHQEQGLPYNPADDGFVFSIDELETTIRRRDRLAEAEEAEELRMEA